MNSSFNSSSVGGETNTPPETIVVGSESPGLVTKTSVTGYPRSIPFSKAVD